MKRKLCVTTATPTSCLGRQALKPLSHKNQNFFPRPHREVTRLHFFVFLVENISRKCHRNGQPHSSADSAPSPIPPTPQPRAPSHFVRLLHGIIFTPKIQTAIQLSRLREATRHTQRMWRQPRRSMGTNHKGLGAIYHGGSVCRDISLSTMPNPSLPHI